MATVLPHIDRLRIYYNRTIRPELERLDRIRVRALRGIALSVGLILVSSWVAFYFDFGFLVLLLLVPLMFYGFSLYARLRNFRKVFKPAVVELLLSFLNDELNYTGLEYEPERAILRDRFERSGLFRPHPDSYQAEDYLRGMVGEMMFEMGEAYVREVSPATNKLDLVFSGLFMHARFAEPTRGQLAVWPRRRLRRLKRIIDAYVSGGGIPADIEIMNRQFAESFAVYAKKGTIVKDILTPPMQDALLNFYRTQDRDFYFSVHNQDLFVGLAHDRDLLEPRYFKTNVSFGLIREFYSDITLALGMLRDFDQTH